ncbi:MAG: YidC/Oxa1 family membrane protein insertase [Treponema sp.]|nr:YidC/Oxa1 family membrane protein insertase [Treponema sp.]
MVSFLYTLIIYPIRLLLDLVFTLSMRLTNNAGLSIICISAAVSLLCLPLYIRADALQKEERDKQRSLDHWSRVIKKAFSGDEQYFIMNQYYRLNHYNPLMVLRSSFGLLIQIPFFIAAYGYISHLDILAWKRFLFIWNLAMPDGLLLIGPHRINVLPIAMTTINVISGIIYTKDLALKDKLQLHIITLLFLLLLYKSPSGLVLYWTCNNIFSLIKNIFYKLPHPKKAVYVLACVLLAAFSVWELAYLNSKLEYKVLLLIPCMLTFALPLELRLVRYLMGGPLVPLLSRRGERFKSYILACILLFLLTGLAIPSALIASSASEFAGVGGRASPLHYLFTATVQSAGLTLLWPLCIYLLFRSRVQTALAACMGFVAFAALMDAYIFMLPYGDISSSLNFLNSVDFKMLSPISFLNLLALALLAVLTVFLLSFKRHRLFIPIALVLCLSLLIISVANIRSIRKEYRAYAAATDKNRVTSIRPIFHLSRNHENVLLIMLDRAQPQYVSELFKEDPSLGDAFDGFTFYKNIASFNGHTLEGAPPLYGGYEYTPLEMNRRSDEPLVKKSNESQLVLPRIFTEELGYTAVVTDPEWGNYNSFCDTSFINEYNPLIRGVQTSGVYSAFWFKEKNSGNITDKTGARLERNMLLFSAFRAAPIILRKMVYNDGNYCSNDLSAKEINTLIDCYSALDYLPELTTTEESEGGFYLSLTNQLTHTSFYLEAPGYIPVDHVTDYGSSAFIYDNRYYTQMATFKMLAKWFNYMKAEGVWDNTRIIVVSDHGCYWNDVDIERNDELDNQIAGELYNGRGHYHPLMLFKDFGSRGSLVTDSETFMTNADTPSLLLKGLVEKPVNPFTGKEIPLDTTELKKDGAVISVCDRHRPSENGKYQFSIDDNEWWRVRNNIFEAASWSREEVQQ